MIVMRTEMEDMPENCIKCQCGCRVNEKFLEEMANEALTDEEWNIKRQEAIQTRLKDCPLEDVMGREEVYSVIESELFAECKPDRDRIDRINRVLDRLGLKESLNKENI